ncbi:MFS transporter, DHA1 family, bicyclomycin/chloramphenicol resistance protein [Actinokineospora iranica]|uniref:MFS transporter, DHA1 family, bicyclomycin/chloramphenicol resistance protein n=1 Tax=Actinokineospora iranica TaxID=1271860 RepID=A0A1G6VBP5_9PSEU|nr:MFS transporter, DHA1 family, bicyclomycin/chloramphenicol resistance protein [Actinokineospora iranica]
MYPPPRATKPRLALILGGLTAFGPLSIDMYLPAFPQLSERLATGQSQVQLTLTAFMVGLAAGQVVAGPLSDSFGRRRPLLIGLVLYTLSSLACAIAPSVYTLIGLRFAQGVSAAAGVVIARAAVRDLFSGAAMARFFSVLMLVNGLAPMLAPIIGGQVLRWTSWSGVFVVLAGFGVVLLVVSAFGLPETLPVESRRPAHLGRTLRTYLRIVTDRTFIAYGLAAGFTLGAMFAYIAGSSFVLQDIHGLSPQQFSLVFGANALGLMLTAQLNGLLLRWFSPRVLLTAGLVASAVGGLAVLGAIARGLPLPYLLAGLAVVVASVGMVSPNSMALALADHAHRAGTASAMLGVLQFVVGGLAAPLVGLGGHDTALPMGLVVAGLSVSGLAAFALIRPTSRRPGRYVRFREAPTVEIEYRIPPELLYSPKTPPQGSHEGGGEHGHGPLGPPPGFRGRFRGDSIGDIEELPGEARREDPQ